MLSHVLRIYQRWRFVLLSPDGDLAVQFSIQLGCFLEQSDTGFYPLLAVVPVSSGGNPPLQEMGNFHPYPIPRGQRGQQDLSGLIRLLVQRQGFGELIGRVLLMVTSEQEIQGFAPLAVSLVPKHPDRIQCEQAAERRLRGRGLGPVFG